MRTGLRPPVVAALALCLTLGACEDPQARRQSEFSAALAEATATFDQVTAGRAQPGGEAFSARRQALNDLRAKVSGLQGAADGRSAAQAMLLASIHRELASMSLAEAAALEQELHQDRQVIDRMLQAAGQLAALAEGRESIDLAPPRALLDGARSPVVQLREEVSGRLAELEQPITALTRDNEQDRVEVDRLSREANTLRREAAELGDLDGFGRFEEAIGLEREADRFENRIAHREVELDYELRPEHELARIRLDYADALIAAVEQSEVGLDGFAAMSSADAQTTRGAVARLVSAIDERLAGIDMVLRGEEDVSLAAAYQQAGEHLVQGARQATQAAGQLGGDDASSARLTAAHLHALRGRGEWERVHGLDRHRRLLSRLIDAEASVGDVSRYRQRLDEVAAAQEESRGRAEEAYEAARGALGQVSPRAGGAAVQRFTATVEAALAGLRGEEAPEMPLSLPSGAGAPPEESPEAAPTGDGGAESHEALIRTIAMIEPTVEGNRAFMELCRSTSPDGRAAIEATGVMAEAMAQIDAALRRRFGEGFTEALGGTEVLPQVRNATLLREDDETAVYSYEAAAGMTTELTLRRFPEGWFVDFDRLIPGGPDALAMVGQQGDAYRQLTPTLVRRIDEGEFATLAEATQAIRQELMKALFGGGLPGPPG